MTPEEYEDFLFSEGRYDEYVHQTELRINEESELLNSQAAAVRERWHEVRQEARSHSRLMVKKWKDSTEGVGDPPSQEERDRTVELATRWVNFEKQITTDEWPIIYRMLESENQALRDRIYELEGWA